MRFNLFRTPVFAWGAAGFIALTSSLGCEGPAPGCASPSDCGAADQVCDACPLLGEELCVEGACVARPADAIDVVATINLDRDIAGQVESVAYVIASTTSATGAFDCATAFANNVVSAAVAPYATGFKGLSGGSFHPDVSLGRAPDVAIAVLLLATDDVAGGGNVVATGCAAAFSSGDVINVDP